MNEPIIQIQSSGDSGDRNEKSSGVFLAGRLYRILMPRFRNGSVKSMTCSRTKLILSAATARSAFFSMSSPTMPFHLPFTKAPCRPSSTIFIVYVKFAMRAILSSISMQKPRNRLFPMKVSLFRGFFSVTYGASSLVTTIK